MTSILSYNNLLKCEMSPYNQCCEYAVSSFVDAVAVSVAWRRLANSVTFRKLRRNTRLRCFVGSRPRWSLALRDVHIARKHARADSSDDDNTIGPT